MRTSVAHRTTVALFSVLVFTQVACAALPRPVVKLDPSRLIERGNGYQQGGRDLDAEDMVEKLSQEPAAAPHVRRSQTLSTIALILAAAGGGLVGWPVGSKLGGDDDPPWELAYTGAGAVLLAVPLMLWGVSSFDRAVDAHNSALGTPPSEKASKPRDTEGRPSHGAARPSWTSTSLPAIRQGR